MDNEPTCNVRAIITAIQEGFFQRVHCSRPLDIFGATRTKNQRRPVSEHSLVPWVRAIYRKNVMPRDVIVAEGWKDWNVWENVMGFPADCLNGLQNIGRSLIIGHVVSR